MSSTMLSFTLCTTSFQTSLRSICNPNRISNCPRRPRRSPRASLSPENEPPVEFVSKAERVRYSQVLTQASQAIQSSRQAGKRLLTVDIPPERSETSAGTLVSRYENNLNFSAFLLESLCGTSCTKSRVGGDVDIRDNVNPQGGGEYLSDDEVMFGFRAYVPVPVSSQNPSSLSSSATILMNAGVDAGTLKQAKDLDDGGTIILLNCGLDRLSWFAKMGFREYIESFEEAYYLKNVAGMGWLLKAGTQPWRAFVRQSSDAWTVVYENEKRPKIVDVEAMLRKARAETGTSA